MERDFFAPEPRRFPVLPLVALGLAGFGFLAVVATLGWWASGSAPEEVAAERPPPVGMQSAPDPAPAPQVVPGEVAQPVTVTLRSHPPGAKVLEDGVEIGETPVEIPLTGGAVDPPRKFQLRLQGYAPHTVSQGWSATPVEHT